VEEARREERDAVLQVSTRAELSEQALGLRHVVAVQQLRDLAELGVI
jgi:hypothetical protein